LIMPSGMITSMIVVSGMITLDLDEGGGEHLRPPPSRPTAGPQRCPRTSAAGLRSRMPNPPNPPKVRQNKCLPRAGWAADCVHRPQRSPR
jgi:hypothetical protein